MNTKKESARHRTRYRWTEDYKMNRAACELKVAVQKILGAHQLLECFRESDPFFARIEVPNFLSLTICKDGSYLTVANYFQRDGEQEADPAVDLEIGKDGDWYPVHVHLADDYRSCIDGPLFIDFEERRKQVAFAAKWAADLLTSGYEAGEITQLSGEIETKTKRKDA